MGCLQKFSNPKSKLVFEWDESFQVCPKEYMGVVVLCDMQAISSKGFDGDNY